MVDIILDSLFTFWLFMICLILPKFSLKAVVPTTEKLHCF